MTPALLHLTAALAGRADQDRNLQEVLLIQQLTLHTLHPSDLHGFGHNIWDDDWAPFEGLDFATPNSAAQAVVVRGGRHPFFDAYEIVVSSQIKPSIYHWAQTKTKVWNVMNDGCTRHTGTFTLTPQDMQRPSPSTRGDQGR